MNLWLQVLSDSMIMMFCIVSPNKADLQMWCNVLLWPPSSCTPLCSRPPPPPGLRHDWPPETTYKEANASWSLNLCCWWKQQRIKVQQKCNKMVKSCRFKRANAKWSETYGNVLMFIAIRLTEQSKLDRLDRCFCLFFRLHAIWYKMIDELEVMSSLTADLLVGLKLKDGFFDPDFQSCFPGWNLIFSFNKYR